MNNLTENELAVLREGSNGKFIKNTAINMGITHNRVRHFRASATGKLRARNFTHAVAIAVRWGII